MSHDQATWDKLLREGFVPPEIGSDVSLPDAVALMQQAFEEWILGSDDIRMYVDALPKGAGTNCPDSETIEILRYVARQRARIGRDDPSVRRRMTMELVMPAVAVERELVFGLLQRRSESLTPDEIELVRITERLVPLHDRLWEKWFAAVCEPYQALSEAERKRMKRVLEGQLATYDYSIYEMEGDDVTNRRTFATAFPELMQEILSVLANCVFDSRELSAYVRTLYTAYRCTDVGQLEQMWRDVDIAWVALPTSTRLLPVHGFESGYGHPYCVNVEFMLSIRSPQFRAEIGVYRDSTLAWAAGFEVEADVADAFARKLGRTDVGVFVDAIRSGARLDQRFAGQSLPNRADVAVEHGGRVFLDPRAGGMFLQLYREAIERICTPETAAVLAPLVTDESFLDFAAAHEFGHPFGRSVESDQAMGETRSDTEEAKASSIGVIVSLRRHATAAWARYLVAHVLARVSRFLRTETLGDESRQAYVREECALLTTLVRSGIAKMTATGIDVDFDAIESGRWREWADRLETLVIRVVDAYIYRNPVANAALVGIYCDRSDGSLLAQIIVWNNRP